MADLESNFQINRMNNSLGVMRTNIGEFLKRMLKVCETSLNQEERLWILVRSSNLFHLAGSNQLPGFKKIFLESLSLYLRELYDKLQLGVSEEEKALKPVESKIFPSLFLKHVEVLGHVPALLVAFDFQVSDPSDLSMLQELLPYCVKLLAGKEAVGSFFGCHMLGLLTPKLSVMYLEVLGSMFIFEDQTECVMQINVNEYPREIILEMLGE